MATTEDQFKINPAKPDQPYNILITDFFMHYDEVQVMPDIHQEKKNLRRNWIESLKERFYMVYPIQWVFLLVMTVVTCFLALLIDKAIYYGALMRMELSMQFSWSVNYLVWIATALFFTFIACSVGEYISRECEGSGIPEVKAILAGVHIYKYLSYQTLVGKFLGLISAIIAGLSAGRAAPFVHLSAAVTHKLSKLRVFRQIEENQSLKKQMIAASVAVGNTACMGAPIGSVVYGIELTSTYYLVGHLWKSFYAALLTLLTFTILKQEHRIRLYNPVEYSEFKPDIELLYFAILGLLCGVLGAFFVRVMIKLAYLRTKIKLPYLSNRWVYTLTVGLITALCSFPIPFLRAGDKTIINDVFNTDNLTDNVLRWKEPEVTFNLAIYCLMKFILTVMTLSSPIPCGVFAPVFALGAVFGRLFGHILGFFLNIQCIFDENLYAIVGGASVAGCATQTISTAIIAFELDPETSHLLPIFIGVIVAYSIGSVFSMSIFDVLLEMRGLPYLPSIKSKKLYKLNAEDLMNKNYMFLTKESTYHDIAVLLQHIGLKPRAVPVVESIKHRSVFCTVEVQSLRTMLFAKYEALIAKSEPRMRPYLQKYLKQISHSSGVFSIVPEWSKILHREVEANNNPRPVANTYRNDENMQQMIDNLNDSMRDSNQEEISQKLADFWKIPIDYESPIIEKDYAPFCVLNKTPMSKIHFLFTVLRLVQVVVIKNGMVVGMITKHEFLRKRSKIR